MQAVRIKFGIIIVSINGQIINLNVKRGEPYHNKGIAVADCFKVDFTQKLAVGDRVEISFDPRSQIKNFELDNDETVNINTLYSSV